MNAAERRAKEVPMSARALFRKAAVLLLAVLVAASCAQKKAPPAPTAGGGLDPEQARAIAVEAYLYGYPLVTMEYTRRILTNAVEPGAGRAPMNRFAHVRTYVTPGHKEVVWPNSDTLYSTAWLDLSAGPMVLSLPDTRGRYYLMQVMSAWTEVLAAPGSRTSGTQAQKWVLTGPGWKGVLPPDMREIRSPTNLVWIVGRTYCEGTPEDYALVHALQDQYVLKPLAEWGKAAAPQPGRVDPAVDMKTPVREQVEALSAAEFFRLMTRLMRDNPALPQDAPLLEKMAKVGIVPGQDFDLSRLPLAVAGGVAGAPRLGLARIAARATSSTGVVNGWALNLNLGAYGTDYESRAYVAAEALGANLPQDAVYPKSQGWYTGEGRYVLRFPADGLPPVNAFWSLTLYDDAGFLVANPLGRSSLGTRDALKPGPDGSVTLYIQHDSPGPGKEANWLPAPTGTFNLLLRLYWPKTAPPSILDGTWTPPEIELAQ